MARRLALPFAMLLLLPVVAEGQRRPGKAVTVDTAVALSPKGVDGDYGITVAQPIKISPDQERRWRETTAVVSGLVTDSATGTPVWGAMIFVHPGYGMGFSDSTGAYEVESAVSGRRKVRVERRGFEPLSRPLDVEPGDTLRLNLALSRAPAPCCRLDGTWRVRFVLEKRGAMGPEPTDSVVEGTITFADSIPDPRGPRRAPDPYVHTIAGLSELDFSPFFGGRIAQDVSTTINGPMNATFDREAVGQIHDGASVEVDLIPRMSHGGVSMWGTTEGEVIRGQWVQRAYCCGATGVFEMRRVRPGP